METDSGHNVLISAGQPLLQALIMLAQGGTPPDLTLFRQQMLQGVSRFYRICTARQLHPSLTGKSAFVWCAALDEAVLSTSWGEESVWQEHTLTGAVFQNRRGGEAFFRYLHLALHNPVPLRDFLELQFYLLSLGFRGEYRTRPEALAACYTRLRHILMNSRPAVLSAPPGRCTDRNHPAKRIPLSLIFSGSLLLCAACRVAADFSYQQLLQQLSDALTALF
ncbi:type IVB secretion system protein IcmH/DotU [Morganella morganii]|uniref:type IVB secretion system protein IcmH/DotU n=1 Tax=Morganella morganii TaxID=582 RepID=UPI002367FFC5|nr:type IVB secretion system protein IcmH/DotU [Morganella morganii]